MSGYEPEVLARSMRVRRAELDISQHELAQRMGVSTMTVTSYEGGSMTPGADKLFAMAEALECTPHELIGWK